MAMNPDNGITRRQLTLLFDLKSDDGTPPTPEYLAEVASELVGNCALGSLDPCPTGLGLGLDDIPDLVHLACWLRRLGPADARLPA